MERIQSVTGPREDGRAACAVCETTLDAERCGHCGAAVAPGGYRVQRLISQSVHGRVYLAVDAEGRRVALKELLFALVPGVEQLDAFEREAAVLRSLSHPDIPRFVASFQEGRGVGTRLYLVQEYLEGESLLQRLERQRLAEDEAWTLAEQVLETLQALHQRTPALIHRDVKPANLILRPGGRAALVDFGAARHLTREVTHGATLVGTFGYMPPEQLGGTVEPSSDLYALGATLVHALSGRMPADLLDEGLAVSFEPHVRASPPMLTFLKRLLAQKRSERFASAAEALSMLRAAGASPPEASRGDAGSARDARARHATVWDVGASPVPQHGSSGGPARDRRSLAGPSRAERQAQAGEAVAPATPAEEEASLAGADVSAASRESAAKQGASEDRPEPSSKRRWVRLALVGLSLAGLLVGALLASGVLAPAPVVVVSDPPEAFAPARPEPLPPSRAAPSGNGPHRSFRTPWPEPRSR